MEVVEFGRLTDTYRAELEGDELDPFDAAGNTMTWRPKDRHVALRGPDGRLVASAGIVLTELQIDDASVLPAVGIGGVIVNAAYRGQGLASRLLGEVLRLAGTLGPQLVILFCHRDRAGLYQRSGFVEIPPPVVVRQPGGFVEISQVSMWRALDSETALPAGRVALLTYPF